MSDPLPMADLFLVNDLAHPARRRRAVDDLRTRAAQPGADHTAMLAAALDALDTIEFGGYYE